MIVDPADAHVSTNRARRGMPTCVVVGLHQNGLGVVRALGRRGVPVIAVDQAQNDAYGATRYARRVSTHDLRGPGLIDTLEEIGRSLDQRGVLTLTLDRSVLLVSEHRARIEPYFVHSLPPDPVVQCLMNKSDTERFAKAHGFKVPRTCSIRTEDDLERAIATIELPCILKPEVKTVAFVEHSPKKAFFVRTVDELRETWHRVVQWEPGVVIQEWIPGPETRLVFCLYYFDAQGRPVASFTGRKIRQFISHCGTACSAEPWDDDVAYAEGVRFFQAAGYRGFGAIEFKVSPDGQYFLIEPTVGRTEHIFALAAANGINLPYAGYCDMGGLPVPAMTRRRRPVVYVDLKRDFRAAQALVDEGSLSWLEWAGTLARPQQHALFAWDDPGPTARNIQERARRKVRRLSARVAREVGQRAAAWSESRQMGELGAAAVPRTSPAEPRAHIEAAIDWLCAAQDAAGGGVARAYSFSRRSGYPLGWQAAYPETTGYIIPTFFDCATRLGRPELAERAIRMADWEISVQHGSGGFPGGTADRQLMPVVFNTGMVLQGLTRAFTETRSPRYREAIARAAGFLVDVQANDGAWRRFVNMNGEPHIHAYDCLVNWGLLLAARELGDHRWADAARRNLDFTLTLQQANGWFAHNALRPARNSTPITHTVAYATTGLLESGLLLDERRFVDAAERTAVAVAGLLGTDGFLPGELDRAWAPAADWSCLTGTSQMAIVWWRLFDLKGDARFADAASRATSYVRCRQELTGGGAGVRGGVAGSFPPDARYGRGQFLNWAAKFLIDALLLEEQLAPGPAGRRREAISAGVTA